MSDIKNVADGPLEDAPAVRPQARPIESRFLYVDIAAARAKQLRKGATVRLER
jgi:DNA-directed RNA polymerase subunit K/omega